MIPVLPFPTPEMITRVVTLTHYMSGNMDTTEGLYADTGEQLYLAVKRRDTFGSGDLVRVVCLRLRNSVGLWIGREALIPNNSRYKDVASAVLAMYESVLIELDGLFVADVDMIARSTAHKIYPRPV